MKPTALIRLVPDTFTRCVTAEPVAPPLDPDHARRQHAAYRITLEEGGFEVVTVLPDERHPDGCFIEDAAVVIGDRALATRPGHPSRRGEVESVAAALAGLLPVEHMGAPATLDGGDVLQAGGTIFVGLSARINRDGIEALARFAGSRRKVVAVPVSGVLHLKSALTALDDETLLMESGYVEPNVFDGMRIVTTPPGESHGANVVRLPDGRILAAAGLPRSAEAVAAAGFEVTTVDISEFARADGGLTCLSVRIRDLPG